MGTASSLEEYTTASASSSSLTSGYQSIQTVSEDIDTLSELPSVSKLQRNMSEEQQTGRIKAKPPLLSRPSLIIETFAKQEEEQEKTFEDNVIKNTPTLKKTLKDLEVVKKEIGDEKKQKPEKIGEIEKMLQEKVVDVFNKYKRNEQRHVLANRIAKLEIVKPLVAWSNFAHEHFSIEAVLNYAFVDELRSFDENPPSEPYLKEGYTIIMTIREILWNYSDSSHRFSNEIAETNFIEMLVNDLNHICKEEFEEIEQEENVEDMFPFSSAVGILHNCARNPEISKDCFRKAKAVEVLRKFLKASSNYVKMITLLALCNMVSEQELRRLDADSDVINFLMDAVNKAVESADHKEHGFHLAELVDGLASMAQSDENKKKIMDRNVLELVMSILNNKTASKAEKLASVKLAWELSFADAIKTEIKKKADMLEKLRELQKSKEKDLKDAADGVMFRLVDMDQRKHSEEISGHVMISYCWGDNKDTVYRIFRELRQAGFPIWIDIEEMGKYMNVLEGMARAVEKASVILICYSEKYKNSTNCRTEADYVYVRQKTFIPIKMQRDYTPDGWLGAMIGAKLYIEFSGKHPFQTKLQELIDRLTHEIPNPNHQTVQRAPVQDPSWKSWSKEEVGKWLVENKLNSGSYKKVRQLTGSHLAYLRSVLEQSPDTYFRWLETKLDLKTLDDTMYFDEAFRALGH